MTSSPATPQRRIPELEALDPATADRIAAHAAHLVAGFRPLTDAQRDLLATLLRPSAQRQLTGHRRPLRRRANPSTA